MVLASCVSCCLRCVFMYGKGSRTGNIPCCVGVLVSQPSHRNVSLLCMDSGLPVEIWERFLLVKDSGLPVEIWERFLLVMDSGLPIELWERFRCMDSGLPMESWEHFRWMDSGLPI